MGMIYFDEAKIDILKELSINIAKSHDIYGLVLKDEFLINVAYLQKVTDSIDQLGAINEKMQKLYFMLADKEEYEKYKKEEELNDRWVPKIKIINGKEKDKNDRWVPRFKVTIPQPQHKYLTDEEIERNQELCERELESKWGYNPYEE